MSSSSAPPWLWARLLRVAVPGPVRQQVVDDLGEIYALMVRDSGSWQARSWYRRQVLGTVVGRPELGFVQDWPSPANFLDWQGRNDAFEVLGTAPLLGRVFDAAEAEGSYYDNSGNQYWPRRPIVIGESFWRRSRAPRGERSRETPVSALRAE